MDREDLIQDVIESLAKCQRMGMRVNWHQTGLSQGQISMLYMLRHHQPTGVKKIAEYLGISKSAVTQLMEPLISKNLVTRQSDAKDRRIAHLNLSNEGSKLVK